MTLTWETKDRHWRVRGITIDTDGHGPRPLFRVEHDEHTGIPLHVSKDGPGLRFGPVITGRWTRAEQREDGVTEIRTGPWCLAGDVFPASKVEQWVDWDQLEEVAA